MGKRSKLYRSRLAKVDSESSYTLSESFNILKEMDKTKFDETVEVSFRLGIDPRKSDQNVRGAIPLPKGTGKQVTVAVIADEEQAKQAKSAGAEHTGLEELIDKIKGGWLEFDVLIATPAAMAKVRPLGRVLGPRGLMPNPKTGTVTDAIADAVAEAKAGRVEYRADKGGCVHVPIGKLSFSAEDLSENFDAVLGAIMRAKPATAKGTYVKNCSISSTMSPGIKINPKELVKVS